MANLNVKFKKILEDLEENIQNKGGMTNGYERVGKRI